MIKDKVLIVCDYAIAKNEGGPRGYFNKCVHENVPKNVHILNEQIPKKISVFQKIQLRLDVLTSKIFKREYRNKLLANKFIKVKKYKYLYFHDMYSFYDVLHLIQKDQVVLFQSHAPEIPSDEEKKLGMSEKNYNKVLQIEKAVFNRANYLVLPNEECKVIYTKLIQPHHKFLYLQTGIKPILNVPTIPLDDSKINLFYIGRKNDIKGYHNLIQSFKTVLKKRNDVRLFIAGSGTVKEKHEAIIDLGITHVAYSWVKSMDFIISPNQASYFDLNVLEAIAIHTPLIMTVTEGHTFFKDKKGIIPINSENISDILSDKTIVYKSYKKEVKEELQNLYTNELSGEVYKQRLEKLANTVIEQTI